MRYLMLKQKLIRTGLIMGGVLVACGIVTAGISYFHSDAVARKQQLEGQVQSSRGEATRLQAQYVKAKESLQLYDAINKRNENAGLDLNRDNAKRILDLLKERYLINNLSVTVSPVTAVGAAELQKKSLSIYASDVELKFDALTDENLYGFINAIKPRFPGYIRITKFQIERLADLDTTTVALLRRGELPSLVGGELSFKWYGIKYNNTDKKAGNAPAK